MIDINEEFTKEGILKHIKHVIDYKDDDRVSQEANYCFDAIMSFGKLYNDIANQLIESTAGKSNDEKSDIVGYIQKNPRGTFAKYDKKYNDFVAYDPRNGRTITMYKISKKQYDDDLKTNYAGELPGNEEVDEIDDDSQKLIDSFLKK